VAKGRAATAKKGHPPDPQVALLAIDHIPQDKAAAWQPQRVTPLLGLPEAQGLPLRIKWCHLSQGPHGELLGSCPKMPSDLKAKVSHHVATHDSAHQEEVCGSVHRKTTARNRKLGLELPLGNSTSPAQANEGSAFIAPRAQLALPILPGQVPLSDAASDVTRHDTDLDDHGAMAIFDYHRRNEPRDESSLLHRGDDPNGTPSAPCGRLGHAHGYAYQAQSRQDVCGKPYPPKEQRRCPHRFGVLGSCHRMSFKDHPRLVGPMQRGLKAWQRLYSARRASERTNSYDQAVIANAPPLRLRGLKAFRFAGVIRTLAQLLRRALHFVLDVPSTLGKPPVVQTEATRLFDNRLKRSAPRRRSGPECVHLPNSRALLSHHHT
jgi:hypothetical protein